MDWWINGGIDGVNFISVCNFVQACGRDGPRAVGNVKFNYQDCLVKNKQVYGSVGEVSRTCRGAGASLASLEFPK